MNAEYLALFLRVARTQNISAAGAELGLSPAVASAHINKLEHSLKVRLVHRTTRKVALTEEGHAFLPHAEDVLASISAAKASVGAGQVTPSGTLRITAPASFGRMHLLPHIDQFLGLYPDINIDLKLSDTIVDLVEGGFDVAIRNSALKDSGLIARKLAHDERILCAAPSYIAKYGKPKHPEELKQHNCLTLTNIENWLFAERSQKKQIRIKAAGNFRTDNGEAVRDACINGLGITINSIWSAHEHLKEGSLVEILNEFPLVSNSSIWAIYPSSRLLAPKVRAFIDFCVNLYAAPPYWERSKE